MKIIEALKLIKDLQRKSSDIRNKIASHSAKMSFETDTYPEQAKKVSSWLQSHHDIVLEIESLREKIARTNLDTKVTIELNGKNITKSVHNWISRRRDLAKMDLDAWKRLTDKGLSDQGVRSTTNPGEVVEFKVVRFYDPEERDKMIDSLQTESVVIDSKLEIVNAITDIVE